MSGRTHRAALVAALTLALTGVAAVAVAQEAGTQRQQTAREQANIDLTGYWVSVVTEDWRFRMLTPPHGDYTSVPLNPEGKRIADSWDWERDHAQGAHCKPYGAPNIMRMPGRLRITWENDNTLLVETDAGSQVRRLQFAPNRRRSGERTWQGVSVAEWERTVIPATGLNILTQPPPPPSRALKVTTTQLRAGYLRRNGVPYSESTVLTEYFDLIRQPNGVEWLVITSIVDDPRYLIQPFVTTSHFKREPDGSKWSPTPCEIWPPTRGSLPAFPQRFTEQ